MGNVLALDTRDGKTLWHAGAGAGMESSPITYELDGRQYVVTSSGGVLFAWKLPESVIARTNETAAAKPVSQEH